MRGSSALEATLEKHHDDDVAVFVVWEPILVTDVAPPTSDDLARCHDPRARQIWDEGGGVAGAVKSDSAPRHRGQAWDYVALYAPGARWEATLPAPIAEGGPVVDAAAEIDQALR